MKLIREGQIITVERKKTQSRNVKTPEERNFKGKREITNKNRKMN